MTCVCPTCHAPGYDVPVDELAAACTRMEAALLRFVAIGHQPSNREIISHIYGVDQANWPGKPDILVRVLACKIRKKIARFGWTILGTPRLGRWRLERVAA